MESFKKRQKEMQRQERQRDKAAKRMGRKQQRAGGGEGAAAPAEPGHVAGDGPPTEPANAQ